MVADESTLFAETATTPMESENKSSERCANKSAVDCKSNAPIKDQINFVSREAIAEATNSEWLVEVVTNEWSFVFHETAHPE